MDSVEQFLGEVGQKPLNPQDSHKILWKKYANGLFSVKSIYSFLEGESLTLALVKILWNPLLPTKVSFFASEI